MYKNDFSPARSITQQLLRDNSLIKSMFFVFLLLTAIDGQHIYLHSLNARCIISQYGSLEHGPTTITATIVDKEIAFMTEV